MRKEFLRQVAEVYLEKEGEGVSDICFVFPNIRSSVFFRRYLGLTSSKPLFSPKLITINSLFSELSGLKTEDRLSLLYSLFGIYTKYIPQPKESFDDFLFWGDMILNDFDDIDKYLVDAGRLFTNIADLKELDFGFDFLSDTQREAISTFWNNFIPFKEGFKEQSFLKLWTNLFNIYSDFKALLSERGSAYEGMIYRSVVEQCLLSNSLFEDLKRYKKVVFVGLNALNNCEKILLNYLRDSSIADFYWDYYGPIVTDLSNKSSLFMKDNVKQYPSLYKLLPDAEQSPFEQRFFVYGVPSSIGQTKIVADILSNIVEESSNGESAAFSTAVILPDENLLLPLLNSIPKSISKVNVTMGYSLSNTNVASFVSLISALQTKTRIVKGELSFYHASVLDILDHPFIKNIAYIEVKALRSDIVSKNLIYISAQTLTNHPFLALLFTPLRLASTNPVENIEEIAHYQQSLLVELQNYVSPIDKECILKFYQCINRLKDLHLPIIPSTYFKLLRQLTDSETISFKGEPLSGLQIMGPLETRALDFENVIVLSMNEGTFPAKNVSNSFIPYNLRKGFDLPNYEVKDSISAYHFYRSIFRAQNIHLLYDTRTEGLKSGEPSRYIMQLKYHHQVPITFKDVTFNISVPKIEPVIVAKTKEMVAKLDDIKFSASLINTYLDCPLSFYYSAIEGIKQQDEVIEEVEPSMFGSLFHSVMESIYKPYIGKSLSKDDFDAIIKDEKGIEAYIFSAFSHYMGIDDISGKNKIIEALIFHYAVQTLKFDKSLLEQSSDRLKYYSSEKRCNHTLWVDSIGKNILFKGFIDRIDHVQGLTRIVDYKTGSCYFDISLPEEMFDSSLENRPKTALQLYLYLYLLSKNEYSPVDDIDNVELDVYSLKDIFKGGIHRMMASREWLDQFELGLLRMIEEMYDLSTPFKGCDNEKICQYCAYKVLCNKNL